MVIKFFQSKLYRLDYNRDPKDRTTYGDLIKLDEKSKYL